MLRISDNLPTRHRHLADTSPTVGRLLVCALAETYRPFVGQPSAHSRPTDGRQTAYRRRQTADRFFSRAVMHGSPKTKTITKRRLVHYRICQPEILFTYMIQYYHVSSILHFFTYQQDSILSCFFKMTPNNLKLLSVTKLNNVCGQFVSNSMLSLPMTQTVNVLPQNYTHLIFDNLLSILFFW